MLIQTKVQAGASSGVDWIEGVVALGKIKLNVYCFATDGVIIDTGAPRLLKDFLPFFEKVQKEKVLLTHSHEDHVGGAAYLQQEYDLPIYASKIGVQENNKKADYPFYRKFFWGKREPFQAIEFKKTIESQKARWNIIETPGHAADHHSFLNTETGQLFSGDLFVHPRTKLILQNESIPTIKASIRHVLTYDFEEVFCCHAGYVRNGREMLVKKLNYLEEISAQIKELAQQGYQEKEIQSKLFGKKYPITYFSFGEWDSLHIVRSVLRESNRGIMS